MRITKDDEGFKAWEGNKLIARADDDESGTLRIFVNGNTMIAGPVDNEREIREALKREGFDA